MSEILTSSTNGLGHITLNRPAALHALNTHMCANMIQALLAWRDDPEIHVILLDHAPGTRGFCAGGDIRMIAESGAKDSKEARAFFHTEYQLNHLLFTYPKPIVALIDGVTMGGGVGISMPARFRVATENTTYAMPETGIGLFPDVGGGWYLPRIDSHIGMWLALTGARIKAADCLRAGIASFFMPTEILAAARAQIAGAAQTHSPETAVRSGLDALSESPGRCKELTEENIANIVRCFSHDTLEDIFAALEQFDSDWARAQLATLKAKSPQALKVTFRQMREGSQKQTFADEMRSEYRLASRVASRHDFQEGVRALIVDKDNKPVWSPATLEGVTDALLDELFAPLPASEEWSPL